MPDFLSFFNFPWPMDSLASIILLTVMGLSMLILFLYYGVIILRIGLKKQKAEPATGANATSSFLPPVSIVILAHNKANILRVTLPFFIEQDYPSFEIVVVNYLSTDDSDSVLDLVAKHCPFFKVVTMRQDLNRFHGDKYPLSIGIKSAKNDLILLSSPDCYPSDKDWIRTMVRHYSNDKAMMVLGYTGLKKKKGLFNALQQYDNLLYHASFLSAASLGMPYTGCGYNLSYRRSFFFKQGAFFNNYVISEGADDMFVNANAKRSNTAVALAPESYMTKFPFRKCADWRRYRKGRLVTRSFYSCWQKWYLRLYPVSLFFFYLSFALLLAFTTVPWYYLVGAVILKCAWQIVALKQPAGRFHVDGIYPWAPLLELYFLFSDTFLRLLPLSMKKKHN